MKKVCKPTVQLKKKFCKGCGIEMPIYSREKCGKCSGFDKDK